MIATTLAAERPLSSQFRQCRASLGDQVLRLQDEPAAIIKSLYRLGSLVVTTLTEGARVSQNMHYPVLADNDYELESVGKRCRLRQRLDLPQWRTVFAVLESSGDLPARSLLFFDRSGQPLQQVAVAPESGGLAFEELVCALLHPDQRQVHWCAPQRNEPGRPLSSLTVLEQQWARSDDEDSFSRFLCLSGMGRLALYQSVRDCFACALQPETVASVLAMAADASLSTTLCTGNSGVRLCMTAPWSRPRWQRQHCHLAHNGVLVSLDMGRVVSLWRLRKPSPQGVVTALEALDSEGQWLWTLSAGDNNEWQWRELLGHSLIRIPAAALVARA